jgi:hypothetical protein
MNVERIKADIDSLLDSETDYDTGRENLNELLRYIERKLEYWSDKEDSESSYQESYC